MVCNLGRGGGGGGCSCGYIFEDVGGVCPSLQEKNWKQI